MHTCKQTICGLALLAAPVSMAGADTLVEYNFNGTEYGIGSTIGAADAAADVVAPGLTASVIGDTISNVSLGINDQGVYDDQVLLVDPDGNAAFDADAYFSFTLTADAGSVLDLDALTFLAARGGGSARGVHIRSSIDGFAADLVTTPDASDLSSQRPVLTAYEVGLSDEAFDAIAGGTTVEFRFYPFSTADGNTVEIDDIRVVGTVVPEPATLGLVLAGGVLLARRRR